MSKAPRKSKTVSFGPVTTTYDTLYEFYENGELTDAMVFIGGTVLKVHKIVLASKSEVLHAMFSTSMIEGRFNQLHIKDIHLNVFKEFIYYMYLNECPKLSKFPVQLLMCADKYRVEGLCKLCDEQLAVSVTVAQAATSLVVAKFYNRTELRKKLINFVRINIREVMKTDNWEAVVGEFDLMTELLLSFPQKTRRSSFPQSIVETTVGLNSEITLNWAIDWGKLTTSCQQSSPPFEIKVGGQFLEMRFVVVRNEKTDQTEFLVVVFTENFDAPLTVKASVELWHVHLSVVLATVKKDFVWSVADAKSPLGALARQRLALRLTQSVMDKTMMPLLENQMKLSITMATTETNGIVGKYVAAGQQSFIFGDYFNSDHFTDVILVAENTTFRAHRIVLAAASPHFSKLFQKQDSEELLTIHEISAKNMNIALVYMYKGRFPTINDVNLELLRSAKFLSLPKLASYCETHLTNRTNVQSAASHYLAGHKLGANKLKANAKRFVVQNIQAVAATVSWKELAENTILLNDLLRDII